MLSTNKLKVTPKSKNASPRTCPPETQQPAPTGKMNTPANVVHFPVASSQRITAAGGQSRMEELKREAEKRKKHLAAIQTGIATLCADDLEAVEYTVRLIKDSHGTGGATTPDALFKYFANYLMLGVINVQHAIILNKKLGGAR